MSKKVKKSVKKFAQKKAKGAVQFKRKHHKHAPRRLSGGSDAGGTGASKAAAAATDARQQAVGMGNGADPATGSHLADMNLDEFLDGGWEAAASAPGRGGTADLLNGDSDSDGGGSDGDGGSSGEGEQPSSSEGEEGLSGDQGDDGESEDHELSSGSGPVGSDDEDGDAPNDADGDDGGDGAATAAVAADNARLRGVVSRHRAQLDALKQQDPEFYAYLQATDAELLGFGADGDSDDVTEEEDEDEEDDDENASSSDSEGGKGIGRAAADVRTQSKDLTLSELQQQRQRQQQKGQTGDDAGISDDEGSEDDEKQQQKQHQSEAQLRQVTSALLETWCTAALEKASMGAMMQLTKAYRAACHYGDNEEQLGTGFALASGAVYNRVLLFMLKEADGVLRRMLALPLDGGSAAPVPGHNSGSGGGVLLAEQVSKAPRWRKVEPLVKSYLGNTLHLLGSMAQPTMTAYVLRRLRASVAFLGPFPRLTKRTLRLALSAFGGSGDDEAPRLQALLLLRQLALVHPPPALATVLRGAYRAYASNAKFVSPATLPALRLMSAGVVELAGLDAGVAYEVGFTSIRELALLLRNALAQKTADAHKEVYCWQTLNCLELWARVLGAAPKGGGLAPLVYPLVQLLLGTARLVPTPRYFPIRLRLVRALNKLAQASGVYVPVCPLLLEMLSWSELRRSPAGGAGAAPDLLLLLRLSKAQLRGAALQEEVVSQVLELLADHLRQWATSVSFPEASHLPRVALRGFAKTCAVERFRRAARGLVDALERNTSYVGAARDGAVFAPQDLQAAAAFLASDRDISKAPLVVYADQLLRKAAQRMALRSSSVQELVVGEPPGGVGSKRPRAHAGEDGKDVPSSSGDSDDGSDQPSSSGGEEEEAVAGAAKRLLRQKEKRAKRAAAASMALAEQQQQAGDGGGGDVLAEFQLSDDERDDDDANLGGGGDADEDDDEDEDMMARGGGEYSEDDDSEDESAGAMQRDGRMSNGGRGGGGSRGGGRGGGGRRGGGRGGGGSRGRGPHRGGSSAARGRGGRVGGRGGRGGGRGRGRQ